MRKIASLCKRLERRVGGRWIVNKRLTTIGKIYEVHFQTGDACHLRSWCGEDNVRDFRRLEDVERFLLNQFLKED